MLEGFSTVTSQSGCFSPICILSFTHALISLTNISGALAVCLALRGEQSGQRLWETALPAEGTASIKGPGK